METLVGHKQEVPNFSPSIGENVMPTLLVEMIATGMPTSAFYVSV